MEFDSFENLLFRSILLGLVKFLSKTLATFIIGKYSEYVHNRIASLNSVKLKCSREFAYQNTEQGFISSDSHLQSSAFRVTQQDSTFDAAKNFLKSNQFKNKAEKTILRFLDRDPP